MRLHLPQQKYDVLVLGEVVRVELVQLLDLVVVRPEDVLLLRNYRADHDVVRFVRQLLVDLLLELDLTLDFVELSYFALQQLRMIFINN